MSTTPHLPESDQLPPSNDPQFQTARAQSLTRSPIRSDRSVSPPDVREYYTEDPRGPEAAPEIPPSPEGIDLNDFSLLRVDEDRIRGIMRNDTHIPDDYYKLMSNNMAVATWENSESLAQDLRTLVRSHEEQVRRTDRVFDLNSTLLARLHELTTPAPDTATTRTPTSIPTKLDNLSVKQDQMEITLGVLRDESEKHTGSLQHLPVNVADNLRSMIEGYAGPEKDQMDQILQKVDEIASQTKSVTKKYCMCDCMNTTPSIQKDLAEFKTLVQTEIDEQHKKRETDNARGEEIGAAFMTNIKNVQDEVAHLAMRIARAADVDALGRAIDELQTLTARSHSLLEDLIVRPSREPETDEEQLEYEEHEDAPSPAPSRVSPPHVAFSLHDNDSKPLDSTPRQKDTSSAPSPFTPSLTSTPRRGVLTNTLGSISTSSETRDSTKRLSSKDFNKFGGGPNEDVDTWIEEVSTIKRLARAEDEDFLRLVPLLLKGSANTWLGTLSQSELESLDTWQGWQDALRAEYRKANFQTAKLKELRYRSWYRNEDFSTYYVNRRRLQKQVLGAHTPDNQLIDDLMDGIPVIMHPTIKTATGQVRDRSLSITDWKRLVIDAEDGLVQQYGGTRPWPPSGSSKSTWSPKQNSGGSKPSGNWSNSSSSSRTDSDRSSNSPRSQDQNRSNWRQNNTGNNQSSNNNSQSYGSTGNSRWANNREQNSRSQDTWRRDNDRQRDRPNQDQRSTGPSNRKQWTAKTNYAATESNAPIEVSADTHHVDVQPYNQLDSEEDDNTIFVADCNMTSIAPNSTADTFIATRHTHQGPLLQIDRDRGKPTTKVTQPRSHHSAKTVPGKPERSRLITPPAVPAPLAQSDEQLQGAPTSSTTATDDTFNPDDMTFQDKTPAYAMIAFDGHAAGKTFKACIDSGSSISLITRPFLAQHCPSIKPVQCSTIKVNGIGGTSFVTSYVVLKLAITAQDGRIHIFPIKFHINSAEGSKIVIGNDFLAYYGATVHIAEQLVKVSSPRNEICLFDISCAREGPITTMRVADSYTIRGFHAARVPVFIKGTTRSDEFYLEPIPLRDGTRAMAAAKTIGSVANTKLIEVYNLEPYPITLRPGDVLGEVHELQQLQPPPSTSSLHADCGHEYYVSQKQEKADEDEFVIALKDADINKGLTSEQQEKLLRVLVKHRHAFAYGSRKLGTAKVDPVRLETGDAHPISSPPYHTSPRGKQIIEETVAKLLSDGIIEESESPWAANVVLIAQKGKIRFCIDYRNLNTVTKADQYPLPRIDDYLSQFEGKRYFTTFDANSGFHQMLIAPEDREKLAFRTHNGLYHYKRMPFGIRNGPSIFQRAMDKVLGPVKWNFAVVYIDDIIVYSADFDTHLKHLEQVLCRIQKYNFTLSLPKSHIAYQEIHALGHSVSRLGIGMKHENVRAILDFRQPQSVKDVQIFLGMSGYYRRFIKDYSKIARPLTALLVKDTQFVWSALCQDAFEKLRSLLASEPILAHPNYDKPFTVYTDGSKIGLGGILAQNGDDGKERMVSAISRQLNKQEEGYTATELECLAVLWALRKFHPYIDGMFDVVLITDHIALQWIWNYKGTNARLKRWSMELQPYKYTVTIKHRPGKNHANVDALSRAPLPGTAPPEDHADTFMTATVSVNPKFYETLRTGYLEDDYFAPIYEQLSAKPTKHNLATHGHIEQFELEDGLLFKRALDGQARQLCIPNVRNLREHILHDHHDALASGHQGIDKTLKSLTRTYYWPRIGQNVRAYVLSCDACQKNKSSNKKPMGYLRPHPVPPSRWHTVTMDFTGPFVEAVGGYDTILVVVDKATKRAHFLPVKKDDGAPEIAEAYFREVGKHHGVPRVIISDRDPKFTGHFWTALVKCFGIKHSMSTASHPQTDGQSERMIRYLKDMLRHFISYTQKNWMDVLPALEFAYNNAVNATTGMTPFELDYGYHPHTPHTLVDEDVENLPAFDDFLDRLATQMTLAEDAVLRAHGIQAKYHNEKHRSGVFAQGDLVWLSATYLNPPWEKKRQTKKLLPKYYGPFRIEKKINDNAYRLTLPSHMKIHPVINIQYLKPYVQSPDEFSKRKRAPEPPETVEGQTGHEELDGILDHEWRRKKMWYLVSWKDQPDHERRWLPRDELTLGAREMLEDYETQHNINANNEDLPQKRKNTPKNRRKRVRNRDMQAEVSTQ